MARNRVPRKVLITGAAGGLGQVLVVALKTADHEVVATDIVGDVEPLDVPDPQACRDAARRHQPDVWINNAGVLHPGDAASQADSDVAHVIDVTLLGTMNGTRAAVEVMRKRGSGHVINVAWLAAWVPVPGETVYAAAKAGVLSFSLGLLAELRLENVDEIEISVVCPDGMLTPMVTDHFHHHSVALSFSGLRTVDPQEVAQRVLDVIAGPRKITSVPRWRGAMLRTMAMAPDALLRIAKPMKALGERNRKLAYRAHDRS